MTIVPIGPVHVRIEAVERAWAAEGDEVAVHRVDGTPAYPDLLDALLEAQPDVVLISGEQWDDDFVEAIVDMVWKVDSGCRVVVAEITSVAGVTSVPGEDVPSLLAALRNDRSSDSDDPETGSNDLVVVAALVASAGWAHSSLELLAPPTANELRGLLETEQQRELSFTDSDGYRHWVAISRGSAAVLALLEHAGIDELASAALGTGEHWLGALEVIEGEASATWRRESVDAVVSTARSSFRPSVSLLAPIDECLTVELQDGSHRALLRNGDEPVGFTRFDVPAGAALVVGAGCRHRFIGRALHLRFIRGWMKPDVLLATALGELTRRLGPQGRRWCGAEIGLPTSVEEFLAVEEAAASGALSQRKGSGI